MRINPVVVVVALFLLVVQPPCVGAFLRRWPRWKANEESKDDEKPPKSTTPVAPSSTSSNTEGTGFVVIQPKHTDMSNMGPGDALDAAMEATAFMFQDKNFQEAMKDRKAQEDLRRNILFVRDFFADDPGSNKERTNTILDNPKAWSAKMDAIADKMAKVTKEKLVKSYLETFNVSAGIIS